MIRTFEELFEKMKAAGHDLQGLMAMHEQYQHWKMESEKNTESINLPEYAHLLIYREHLQGYLSCLKDSAIISQSEYDQLWGGLKIPDIPQIKVNDMSDSLKRTINECIVDLENFQGSSHAGAAYAIGYLHEYPELRKLLTIIACMENE